MRFHLKNKAELDRAFDYLTKQAGREAVVDITKVVYKRSLSQNSYLHLLLSYFGTQAGYTLEEAKDIYKQVNAGLYHYEKHGYNFYRSSADLDTAEMTRSLDKFREWSAEQEIDLPAPNETEFLKYCDDIIAQNQGYL